MRSVNGIGTTLYGSAKRKALPPDKATELQNKGYVPYSYQAVKWVTVLWLPVVPLGTYEVVDSANLSIWDQIPLWSYRTMLMWRVPWDWNQVARHYLIAYGIIFLLWFFFD